MSSNSAPASFYSLYPTWNSSYQVIQMILIQNDLEEIVFIIWQCMFYAIQIRQQG